MVTMQTPLGPVKVFRFIDPFVNISSNVIKDGLLARTPVGLLSPMIRDDLMGKKIAADMALSRMDLRDDVGGGERVPGRPGLYHWFGAR